MEINVLIPGGVRCTWTFEDVKFAAAAIIALERKVQHLGVHQRNVNNIDGAKL